jgi:hypothetical protein
MLTIGPYFHADFSYQQKPGELAVPLNLAIEWATSQGACRIPLFRAPWATPPKLGLHHVVFRRSDLPCDMECSADEPIENFLSLDALLLAIYKHWQILRSPFDVLNELATSLPLSNHGTKVIYDTGLLHPDIEARGFRLNTCFKEPEHSLVQIGWESTNARTRFHTCVLAFKLDAAGSTVFAEWIPNLESGICQLLDAELRRLAPSDPRQILTDAGRQLLIA